MIAFLSAMACFGFGTVSVYIFTRAVTGDPRYQFINSPLIALAFTMTSIVLIPPLVMYGMGAGPYFGPLLIALFALPCGLPLVLAIADRFSLFLAVPGSRGIRVAKTCEQAERAEHQEKFEEAEKIFLKALTHGEKEKYNPKDDAPIQLQYGNFLQRRERMAEAAEQWLLAIEGNLPVEQCVTAAIRISDILVHHLKDRARARAVLTSVLEKHSKEQEAAGLRKRLEALM